MIKYAAIFALEVYLLAYVIATIMAFIIKGLLASSTLFKKKEVAPAVATGSAAKAQAKPTETTAQAKPAETTPETPKTKE